MRNDEGDKIVAFDMLSPVGGLSWDPSRQGKAKLYAELSRFFFDKIGGTNDETHLYYKLRLAEEWHDLLGTPPRGTAQQKADWFRPVATTYSRYILPTGTEDALRGLQEDSAETGHQLQPLRPVSYTPLTLTTHREV